MISVQQTSYTPQPSTVSHLRWAGVPALHGASARSLARAMPDDHSARTCSMLGPCAAVSPVAAAAAAALVAGCTQPGRVRSRQRTLRAAPVHKHDRMAPCLSAVAVAPSHEGCCETKLPCRCNQP